MKNEKDVKAAVKKVLQQMGAWWFMPVANGYGRQGIPDFIVCLDGKFVALETKYGDNKTSGLQELEIDKINQAGGVALVIYETDIPTLPITLAAIREL